MKRAVSMFLCLFGALAIVLPGRAITHDLGESTAPPPTPAGEQPYSPIWVRNVFGLKPNISTQTNNDVAPPAPSNVKLIGIYTLFGKRAILSMDEPGEAPPRPGRPGGPQQQKKEETTYTMSEGERRGSLELLEINVKDRFVKIKNDDRTDILHFETNHVSSPMAGGPHPPPSAMPGFQPPPQPGMYNRGMPAPLPNRTMRSSMQNTGQPNYSAAGYSTGYGSMGVGGAGIPNAFTGSQSAINNNNGQNETAPPAVTAALLELQQQAAQNSGRRFPPLPPGMGGQLNTPPPPPGGAPALPPGLAGKMYNYHP